MKKVAILLAVCMIVSIIAGGSVFAKGQPPGAGAAKMPLYSSWEYDCEDGATTITDGIYGFVILNTDNENGILVVQVALKGALANTEYIVYVNQVDVDSLAPCPIVYQTRIGDDEDGLITNVKGNGNLHVEDGRDTTAEKFWVSVIDVKDDQRLRTIAIVLD